MCIGFALHSHWHRIGFALDSHWIKIAFALDSHSIRIGSALESQRSSITFALDSHRIRIGFRVGFVQETHRKLIGCGNDSGTNHTGAAGPTTPVSRSGGTKRSRYARRTRGVPERARNTTKPAQNNTEHTREHQQHAGSLRELAWISMD